MAGLIDYLKADLVRIIEEQGKDITALRRVLADAEAKLKDETARGDNILAHFRDSEAKLKNLSGACPYNEQDNRNECPFIQRAEAKLASAEKVSVRNLHEIAEKRIASLEEKLAAIPDCAKLFIELGTCPGFAGAVADRNAAWKENTALKEKLAAALEREGLLTVYEPIANKKGSQCPSCHQAQARVTSLEAENKHLTIETGAQTLQLAKLEEENKELKKKEN